MEFIYKIIRGILKVIVFLYDWSLGIGLCLLGGTIGDMCLKPEDEPVSGYVLLLMMIGLLFFVIGFFRFLESEHNPFRF
jgi:hypothetical protein